MFNPTKIYYDETFNAWTQKRDGSFGQKYICICKMLPTAGTVKYFLHPSNVLLMLLIIYQWKTWASTKWDSVSGLIGHGKWYERKEFWVRFCISHVILYKWYILKIRVGERYTLKDLGEKFPSLLSFAVMLTTKI